MRTTPVLVFAAALLGLALVGSRAAVGQVRSGLPAPAFEFRPSAKGGPKSFAEFDGKVVILAFCGTADGSGQSAVPRLNALRERYRDRGLVILGISHEPPGGMIDMYRTRLGATYQFATASQSVAMLYGVAKLPAMVLIDVDGYVRSRSRGVPHAPLVEDALGDVAVVPELPKSGPFAGLRRMWDKRQHLRLHQQLESRLAREDLEPEAWNLLDEYHSALQKRIDSQRRRIKLCTDGPDYYRAEVQLQKIAANWRGFEVADEARDLLASFKSDPQIKREIRSGRALAKLTAKFDMGNPSEARKLMLALHGLAENKKHAGTHAAEQAKAWAGG
ncbi:MAG: TlpA family protein disulfide reductase [bacterium]|nr:TlpA family protein disulfide reductase [bacterium]